MPAKIFLATSIVAALFIGLSQGVQLRTKTSSIINSKLQAGLLNQKTQANSQIKRLEEPYELEPEDYQALDDLALLAFRVRHVSGMHVTAYTSIYQFQSEYKKLAKGAFSERQSFQRWLNDEAERLRSFEEGMVDKLLSDKDQEVYEEKEDFVSQFPDYDPNEWHLSKLEASDIYSLVDTVTSYDNSIAMNDTLTEIVNQVANATSEDEFRQAYYPILDRLWRRVDENTEHHQKQLRIQYEGEEEEESGNYSNNTYNYDSEENDTSNQTQNSTFSGIQIDEQDMKHVNGLIEKVTTDEYEATNLLNRIIGMAEHAETYDQWWNEYITLYWQLVDEFENRQRQNQ
ncbi:UNKNOWN [Stylonychia lemnae]|uniref:Uncharacterized protein n=1 Tax=Stylonychia lemnae TaxID=5949 RepID=A0A078B179_STYLE|nr:UNKNOWN [Stylonychia lemnae]|eukprot:CDW86873.1 UNKNOWN [Stylonychia lemnae]